MAAIPDTFNAVADSKPAVLRQVRFINAHSENGRHMLAVAAASCVVYAIESGDVDPANELVKGIGNNQRTEALVKWFIEFGPFKINESKDGFVFGARNIDRLRKQLAEDKPAFGTRLVNNPFWVWSPPKNAFKPFTLEQLIAQAIQKVEKGKKNEDLTDEQRAQIDDTGMADAKKALSLIKLARIRKEAGSTSDTASEAQPTIN